MPRPNPFMQLLHDRCNECDYNQQNGFYYFCVPSERKFGLQTSSATLTNVASIHRFSGNIILNDQLRTVCFQSVAAEDLQEICTEVVVVIFGEAQTELGDAAEVDELPV